MLFLFWAHGPGWRAFLAIHPFFHLTPIVWNSWSFIKPYHIPDNAKVSFTECVLCTYYVPKHSYRLWNIKRKNHGAVTLQRQRKSSSTSNEMDIFYFTNTAWSLFFKVPLVPLFKTLSKSHLLQVGSQIAKVGNSNPVLFYSTCTLLRPQWPLESNSLSPYKSLCLKDRDCPYSFVISYSSSTMPDSSQALNIYCENFCKPQENFQYGEAAVTVDPRDLRKCHCSFNYHSTNCS